MGEATHPEMCIFDVVNPNVTWPKIDTELVLVSLETLLDL